MTEHVSAQDLFDALSEPFATELVKWRVGGGGKALAYIDARDVMDRFDTVCGCDGWQVLHYPCGGERMACKIGVRLEGEWVWKSDGSGESDIEGEKGAFSGALKRAAVAWGVGRYLYDIDSPKVEMNGKFIADHEKKRLAEVHEKAAARHGWGTRAEVQVYRLLKKVALDFVTDPAAAQEFKDRNAPEIALLPVAMRRHLFDLLDRVGASQSEAAE